MAQVVPRREGDAANKKAQRGEQGAQACLSHTEWPNPQGGRVESEGGTE